MGLPAFLRQLQENGHVRVGSLDELTSTELAETAAVLRELDAAARLEAAPGPPEMNLFAALWAATLLYQGCQFLVFREVDADLVQQALRQPCPETASPAVCYSVDLTFCYLPDLIGLARGLSENDPLVAELKSLARAWPLSSVGVKDLGDVNVSPFWSSTSLRRLYVDRVLTKGDAARLQNAEAREAVQAAWGLHPELGGDLAKWFEEAKAP